MAVKQGRRQRGLFVPFGLRGRVHRRLIPASLILIGLAGCATNPATGKLQLSLISESQEIALGRQSAQDVRASIGLVPDVALQAYVAGVGKDLASRSERPNLPWSFQVVDDPTPNAFALPGGFIFVTRGLMGLMTSEAELATVLGHEIGHVTARHSVEQMSRAELAQVGLGVGSILVPELQQYGNIAGAGLQLLFLKYSRDDERQADQLGFRYALRAGYDVHQMADVFVALQRYGEAQGGSSLPSWLATHPATAERIQTARQRVAALGDSLPGDLRIGRDEYLHDIDGLVWGDNPRNGFFKGSEFLQPDLRFRIMLPAGWKTQNLARSVVAQSPQQDAVLELTLDSAATPAQAAQSFLAQQGVVAGPTSQESINGLQAAAATFDATTQQGAIHGTVTFVAYGGNIYRVMGYATSTAFAGYAAAFQQSAASFGPLDDPAALAVQPDRISIVRLEHPTSLAQFGSRYPSAIPLDQLAILNQVDDASSIMPAGSLAKQVTKPD
jgi:predicted Zn-dependent protease